MAPACFVVSVSLPFFSYHGIDDCTDVCERWQIRGSYASRRPTIYWRPFPVIQPVVIGITNDYADWRNVDTHTEMDACDTFCLCKLDQRLQLLIHVALLSQLSFTQ